MITVSINNQMQTLEADVTVSEALTTLGYDADGMLGVAINTTFIPKENWQSTQLKQDDKVDILNPISGG